MLEIAGSTSADTACTIALTSVPANGALALWRKERPRFGRWRPKRTIAFGPQWSYRACWIDSEDKKRWSSAA